jgi:uncharacterized protein
LAGTSAESTLYDRQDRQHPLVACDESDYRQHRQEKHMKFVMIGWDCPDGAAIRAATRDAHFAHVATIVDRMWLGGPIHDDAQGFLGSVIIYEAETREEAEAMLRADPYFVAKLWDRWSLNPFHAAAGEWVGGTIW